MVFSYDPSIVVINSITAGNTLNSISADAKIFSMKYGNEVRIEMFFPGGSPITGISGSDTIVTLTCTALTTGLDNFNFVTDSVKYRTPDNSEIPINPIDQIINGKVLVK